MPFRPQELDNGFTLYPARQPRPPKTPPTPNLLVEAASLASAAVNPLLAGKYYAERKEVFDAAARQENDIVNMIGLMMRPTYNSDPSFDTAARLKADGLWEDYSDNFVGVQSEEEYIAVKGRIAREQKDREVLASAGMGGLLAQMAMGAISPTALLPFVGELRGGRAVIAGIGAGFAGGALQELPLQLSQETRSFEESVSSIALSAVVGGVLGGAIAFARRTPKQIADSVLDELKRGDMAVSPGGVAIPEPITGSARPASAGAASALGEAPTFAPMFRNEIPVLGWIGTKLEDTMLNLGPVTRVGSSMINQARFMMAQLADAGLEYTGRAIGAVGGNVESRIKTHYGPVMQMIVETDDAYKRYWYGADIHVPFGATRAKLAALSPNRTKLNPREFRQEVSRAMQNGDQHEIPEVAELARAYRKNIYEPLGKAAHELGLFKNLIGDGVDAGDISYLNRVYNVEAIQMRQQDFEAILANHYNQKLVDDFRAEWTRLGVRETRDLERIEDFRRPENEVKQLRADFEAQLREVNEGRNADLAELEDTISERSAALRTLERGSPEYNAIRDEIKALREEGGEALESIRERRATIRRRLNNLRRSHSALSERYQGKLDRIERTEDLSFNTLQRLIRKGQKLMEDLDKISDAKLEAELSKLRTQFAETTQRLDRNEVRINKLFDDEFEADVPTSPFVQAAKVESETFDRLSRLAERIEQVDVFDRVAAREALQEGLNEAARKAQGIVERRAVRNARLADQANKLDPKVASQRIVDLESGMAGRRGEFFERWRELGADDIDPITGAADFKNYALDMARQTTNKILGTYMRLPGIDIIGMKRGAELARVLDIDSRAFTMEDGFNFLEMDIEKLAMMYTRTMGPDIELTRAFGPDFLGQRDEAGSLLNENWKKLDDEYRAYIFKVQEDMRNGVNPETGKPKKYSQGDIDKAGQKLNRQYEKERRDLEAVIGRLRGTWGIPDNPSAFAGRAAKVVSNVNTNRFMSNVIIASIPDIARPIMKHGLLRTFRDGFIPFAKAVAEGNFTPRQLRIANVAVDVVSSARASQIYDVGDYMVRGSKFEKGLEWTTNKIGNIGLFNQWTAAMKQINAAIVNARAADALDIIAGGAPASKADVAEATRFLAANGIDDELAMRMWRQFESGGGEKIGGQWWSNTDEWTDAEAVRAFHAMLSRESDNTIITPGVERPLIADANPYTKLLFQFKSFNMSSTTKTLMAGAQGMRQGDMAFVTGGLISLALGVVSYYTSAMVAGGPVRDRMLSAFAQGDWDKIADEAINRSGLLGIGADVQSAFASTPLAPYTTFSGERTTRRGGDDLYEVLAGPSLGDFVPRAFNTISGSAGVAEGFLSTGQIPLGEIPWNDVRRLLPWQNHFLLRQAYDQIETAAGSLPERRE